MKVLVISDTHINDRASEVPEAILKLIKSFHYDVVIFAGDLTNEDTLEWVKSLAPTSYIVEGNMDYLELPEYEILEVGTNIKLGVIHGHQIYPRGDIAGLYKLASKLGVNILVSGHTHKPLVKLYQGKLLINPGSLTGVISGSGSSNAPSFIVMTIAFNEILVDLYSQVDIEGADYLRRLYRFNVGRDNAILLRA